MGKAGLLELQSQWVGSITAGNDAETRTPVSRGMPFAPVIFRQDTPAMSRGKGRTEALNVDRT